MRIYGMWHGGAGYSYGDMPNDIEAFTSLTHAKDVLREREDNSGRYELDTFYVHRDNSPVRMPAVEGSSMDLYGNASGGEPYARLTFGPRGGVKVENY